MGKEILDYSAQLLPIWAVQRNINPICTWHFMHSLIYESKGGRRRKKRWWCQQLLTLVLVFLFRCKSQECLVTFYECIRQDRGHFLLFFAINTKLTCLCWIYFRKHLWIQKNPEGILALFGETTTLSQIRYWKLLTRIKVPLFTFSFSGCETWFCKIIITYAIFSEN